MKKRQTLGLASAAIENFTLQCVLQRNASEVRRMLLEGVDANALNGELLLSAARIGSAPLIHILFAHGATIPPGGEGQILGLPVGAASPAALAEVMRHFAPVKLQQTLRSNGHAVLIIAGDVCNTAKKYLKRGLRLGKSEISTRKDCLLGDAVRLACFELGEPVVNPWTGIVKRSEECARMLHELFVPLNKRDDLVVEAWYWMTGGVKI